MFTLALVLAMIRLIDVLKEKDGSIAESFMVFRIISHCDSIVLLLQ